MLSSNIKQQSYTDRVFYTSDQIASVLNSCSVRVGGEIDTHYLIYCPFHYNVNTPAAEIDKQKGVFICFSCGESGNLMDMVMRVTNRNFFEASRLIKSAENVSSIVDIVTTSLDTNPDELKEFDSSLIDRLHSELLETDSAIEYFESRLINIDSINFFKLGYSKKQKMVIVPVSDHRSMCVGFVGRSIEGKSFKNSVNLPKKHVLFNICNNKFKSIAVVESSFDAIRLHQLGIPAVATLGATISKSQMELLNRYASSIILCPDKDEAGSKMVSSVKKNMPSKSITVLDVGNAKDIGDLSNTQIKELFENSMKDNFIAL